MATYSQAGRSISITTPLGKDVLLLQSFAGSEAISQPFRFRLELLAESAITFDQLLGQKATITLILDDGSNRYINGVVEWLSQGGWQPGPKGPQTFLRYRAEIVPQLDFLKRTVQSRIFQQITVPDILKQVLTGVDYVDQCQGTYEKRDYCVQYNESDFSFASRLMEEEGIYYFFSHKDGSHQMVIADTPQCHPDVPGTTRVNYEMIRGDYESADRIKTWEKRQEIRSGKFTAWDYCFEMPDKHLEASQPILDTVQVGTVSHKLKVGGNDALEIYEYPGRYAQRFDGIAPGGDDQASELQKIFNDNKRTVGIRMQQEALPSVTIAGDGNSRNLSAGAKFTLANHFDANGVYVLTRVEHTASMGDTYTHGRGVFEYANRFSCIPLALPFRPERSTPRPRIDGMQTAVVVGPSGQEIFTDKYSRVKVQFPWDRQGKLDANSSCWVRVASTWSGKQWGFIQIPRIGQEVVVAFEEGDPDRPIITGSVYNAQQMPPYTLPDNMTQSGTKSRSTTQAEAENFNQLMFEDKKGSELVYFHAEKDFQRVVENNDSLKVGFEKKDKGDRDHQVFNNESIKIGAGASNAEEGSQTLDVFNSQTVTIGSGEGQAKEGSQTLSVYKDRTTTIQTGNESLTVKKGNRTVTVETGDDSHEVKTGNRVVNVNTGNDTHAVKKGNRSVEIDLGNDSLTIKTGNQTVKLNAGSSTTEAMQGITLKVGGNSIEITQQGITIKGMNVTIEAVAQLQAKGMTVAVEGQVQTQVKGVMCQVNGDAMLTLKGGITMIN